MEQLDRNILILTARSLERLQEILELVNVKEIHELPQIRAVNLILNQGCSGIPDVDICKSVVSAGPILKLLDLSGCPRFTGEGLYGVGMKFVKLETLNLRCCYGLTVKGVSDILLNSSQLKNLDLSSTCMTGRGV